MRDQRHSLSGAFVPSCGVMLVSACMHTSVPRMVAKKPHHGKGRPPPGNMRLGKRKPKIPEKSDIEIDPDFDFGLGPPLPDEDAQFEAWAASAAAVEGQFQSDTDDEDTDIQIRSLLAHDNVAGSASAAAARSAKEDDDAVLGNGFVGISEDDDEEEDDDDDGDDDDDDGALLEQDDIEQDLDDDDDVLEALADVPSVTRARNRAHAVDMELSLGGAELDVEDDIDDADLLDTLEPGAVSEPPHDVDLDIEDDGIDPTILDDQLDEPTDEELQSAAELLTDSGILGLRSDAPAKKPLSDDEQLTEELPEDPISAGKRRSNDLASVLDLEKAEPVPVKLDEEDSLEDGLEDDLDDDLGDDLDLGAVDEEDAETGPTGLDAYVDTDDEEEDDGPFNLSSRSGSFGRTWDLNEDMHVTITEPGEAYAFELDEEDADDQDMATQRRGSQGGWAGGLQTNTANRYTPGSREWIARRAYDLIAESSSTDMYKWTRRISGPPPAIDKLFPKQPNKYAAVLGRVDLTQSNSKSGEKGKQQNSSDSGNSVDGPKPEEIQMRTALERAVKFPCSYKFKVEGYDLGLVESLRTNVERITNIKLPHSAFETEPSGRYLRVVFHVEVKNAKQVTDLWESFRRNPLVKLNYG